MALDFDPRDVVSLSIVLREKVHTLRPELGFRVTTNPGNDKEHYIALCEKVYEFQGDQIIKFFGYVTYRLKEVRFQSKFVYIPEFSSVEVRKPDFSTFADGKVHVLADKVNTEDPNLVAQAITTAKANPTKYGFGYDLAYEIVKQRIPLIVDKIIQMVDGTLK